MVTKGDSKLFYFAVGKNIKKYRDLRNYSLQVLGEKVGLTKKTIQRYENGEIKIDMDRLADIAEALGVEVPKLMEGAESFLGVDLSELETIKLPIVGRVSCGNGAMAYEDIEGYEETPKAWLNGGEHFYLRAKGDSMSGARIFDGDLLLIRKQPEVENGEIAAVLIGDEAVLKRVYRHGDQLILQSENANYPPILCPPTEARIIGKLKMNVIKY
ncbi:XRE family transcriptional regulator [Brevibacillus borstelensis]|uniref:LexA family protein n=1 Tax=Brevibacillus borstelensis TaxID=45462 RepID=UPI002E2194E4|nr:XRE family transcriptional regulator [Brevibacillus borstelensis]